MAIAHIIIPKEVLIFFFFFRLLIKKPKVSLFSLGGYILWQHQTFCDEDDFFFNQWLNTDGNLPLTYFLLFSVQFFIYRWFDICISSAFVWCQHLESISSAFLTTLYDFPWLWRPPNRDEPDKWIQFKLRTTKGYWIFFKASDFSLPTICNEKRRDLRVIPLRLFTT